MQQQQAVLKLPRHGKISLMASAARFLSTLSAPLVCVLILAPLLCNFVQNDAGCRSEIQAFDHSEHRNADAHLAMFNGKVTYSYGLMPEPYSELCIFRVFCFMQNFVSSSLDMRRSNYRHKPVPVQMLQALFRTVEPLHKAPFDG